MNLKNKIVVHCAQFAAPYEGNFIKALKSLDTGIQQIGGSMIFVLPAKCKEQPWWELFISDHIVYTVERVDCVEEIEQILHRISPSIIHTHFEGFDIPVVKAVKNLNLNTEIVWHLHDCFSFHPNPLKAVYQCYSFFKHYNYYAQDVSVICVGEHLYNFASRFKKITFGDFKNHRVIANGVDIERIRPRKDFSRHSKFTFLAYGGRNADKRVDLLMRAGAIVSRDYNIEILITKGTDTVDVANVVFGDNIPEWCNIISQQGDVNALMDRADCFVSASVHEGHSYAICEASIFGLPIIQSDIPGNLWNAKRKSTYSFHSEDVDDLVRVMREVIIEDEKQLIDYCIHTRELNKSNYSLDKWTKNICSFYEAL